jgi:hypothetical protein
MYGKGSRIRGRGDVKQDVPGLGRLYIEYERIASNYLVYRRR